MDSCHDVHHHSHVFLLNMDESERGTGCASPNTAGENRQFGSQRILRQVLARKCARSVVDIEAVGHTVHRRSMFAFVDRDEHAGTRGRMWSSCAARMYALAHRGGGDSPPFNGAAAPARGVGPLLLGEISRGYRMFASDGDPRRGRGGLPEAGGGGRHARPAREARAAHLRAPAIADVDLADLAPARFLRVEGMVDWALVVRAAYDSSGDGALDATELTSSCATVQPQRRATELRGRAQAL